jgi:VanZ family protein
MEEWKKRFWVFGFPPLLWMGIICALSSIPGQYIPRSWLFHHVGHLIEYSVFGVLLARALAHLRIKLNVWTLSLLSIGLIVLFAIFDEWRQSFVSGRHAIPITIFFDGVYATLGVAMYSQIVFVFLMRKRNILRSKRSASGANPSDV